jgi:hypothetical protein
MTEEEKKVAIGDLYEKINKAQQAAQHQSVLEHTEKSKNSLNLLLKSTHPYH